ncbi:hypothetical protein LSH36_1497g00009 [Paralvinella palmiformis]|uniref:Uncharacterized protein n=1 Tax=Paralvinella palmiformis TaxID=53620 RepID=A0AAD9IT28_9ANNE|nr:hypothetical protein LSH36_1497g00009 [Paralvinella palmiformis]
MLGWRAQPVVPSGGSTASFPTGSGSIFRVFFVAVTCYSLAAVAATSASRDPVPGSGYYYPCPVELRANHSNYCDCNALSEIVCYNLDQIPTFIRDGNVYTGLYMEHQAIRQVSQAVFFDIKVKKITMNFNPIGDRISVNALSGLERILEELQLGQCAIRTLPESLLVAMNQLKILHLWGNDIEEIPDDFFANTNQLRELSLWGNAIGKLNAHTFAGLWQLRKLDLDRNRISNLNKNVFRHLGNLEALHLGENRINTLNSDTFVYAKGLKLLNLDNNGLAYIYDGAFGGLRSLKVLGLQHNKLNYLSDEMFTGLRNLSILWLQHNELEYMWAKNFDNLKRLQELHLSYNRLTGLPDRLLRSCSELAHLFVDHNALSTLKKCSLPRKIRLKTLSLLANPITCDCRLSWILELQKKRTTVWGNCLHTPLKTVTAITDRENYGQCTHSVEECTRQ